MLRHLLQSSSLTRLPGFLLRRGFVDEASALKENASSASTKRISVSAEANDELNAKIDDLLAGILNAVPKVQPTTINDSVLTQFNVKKPELPEDLKSAYRHGVTEEDLEKASDITRRAFSFDNASQSEINRFRVTQAIKKLQTKPYDTGSVESQVSGMTERIKYLTTHMQTHKKDYNSLRGLVAIVNQRRKLMEYLKRKNYNRFKELKTKLSLRIAD